MAMKRILKMSVVLTVIACGVLYGQRALVSAAPAAEAAASLSQLGEPVQVSAGDTLGPSDGALVVPAGASFLSSVPGTFFELFGIPAGFFGSIGDLPSDPIVDPISNAGVLVKLSGWV